jgi:excisionase family DNA binding protein
MNPGIDRLLTLEEAAAVLGTKLRFTRRLVAERRIRFTHAGPPRPHPRVRAPRVHQGRDGRTGDHSQERQGCLMPAKRRFGRVRRLPSGRWQARYKGPDGIDRPAPSTFTTKGDAERWLSLTEADIIKDNWLNPDMGRVLFTDYAGAWIAERPNLRPKTLQLYRGLVRIHLVPILGSLAVADITKPVVRRWRQALLDSGVGIVTVAKAYRLLKAILNTAVDDGLIRLNPCRIKGAGEEKSPERPVLTLSQVFAGASLRELMDRMGHSTTRAALIYQHRTSLRDKMIADEISRRAAAERPPSGTQRARDNGEAS